MPRLTDAQRDEIRRVYADTQSGRETARLTGHCINTVQSVVGKQRLVLPAEATAETGLSIAEEGDSREIGFESDTEIRTLEDAVAFAKVDLATWRVKRWECGGHSVVMKVATYDVKGKKLQERPVKKQSWRVRIYLERILPKPLMEAIDGVFERLKGMAPKSWPLANPVPLDNPHLMILDLHDVHFGKLAWGPECGGQGTDLKLTDSIYRNAVDDLLRLTRGYPIEEFVIVLGSDLFHIDGFAGATSGGTEVDYDGRIGKILETVKLAKIYAIEHLAARAKVKVIRIGGNHDRLLSLCMAHIIDARFHNHPNVTVDYGPAERKYHRYHNTLIGLTHGDGIKLDKLPTTMAVERPTDFAETTCREWHTGHLHKPGKLEFMSLNAHSGIPVRTLMSLSGIDKWHYDNLYVNSNRAAEAYLYDRQGLAGFFVANARET